MLENIINFLRGVIQDDNWSVLLLSILPMIELRGAIPIAIGMGVQPFKALLLAAVGSSIAIIPNIVFVKPFLVALKQSRFFKRIVDNFESDITNKTSEINRKAEKKKFKNLAKYVAIAAFVAIPLPFTGAYTGSTLAVFLDLDLKKSFIAVTIGNIIAGSIITLLSVYFSEHLDIVIWILAVIVIFAFLVYIYRLLFRKNSTVKIKKIKLKKSEKSVINENR